MNTTARDAAEMDIREELSRQGKCFIAFVEKLNPVMDLLVDQELKIREQWKNVSSK